MNITSARFVKGIIGTDDALEREFPQVAFIGRSNVGKSTLINSLTKQKGLARASAHPGRTKEINLFLINDSYFFLDLPGYGYAKDSLAVRVELEKIIFGYLFDSPYVPKVIILIIDAKVGPKDQDLDMLRMLEEHGKNVLVVANKVDKVKKSEYKKQLGIIQEKIGEHLIIPYSSEKGIGRQELLHEIFDKR
ncbi:MAG: ribosome biogenesis GTP-binding protein YsxC [Candidatus Moranbacteria bacterium]|nr:ribosome biogenesis GTP-binding protein YsxC [Candidatus Moranbacteria bacterium]